MLSGSQSPTAEGGSPLSESDQVDLVCDAFETAWAAGEEPVIEEYLERCDPRTREALLSELLLLDCDLRRKRGETVSREAYEQRFPGFSKMISKLPFETVSVGDSGGSTSRALQFTEGSKIAHFELLEEIGMGASGAVWRARDTRLGRTVAVKIPRQERLTPMERERFLREGQAAAKLRHPNIVTLFDVGEEQGRAFIVSELVEGTNLREWLERRRPTPREAAELLAQLAEALHHAHENGVIHRDLKPANVLVDNDGRAHITDFGLAKMMADSTTVTLEGHILGTPIYMSPEQALGDTHQIDRRTDVYGLGAIMYELISGEPPFAAGDVSSIVHQVIHTEPRLPRRVAPAVPRDLETICLKAIHKVPGRRYPTTQEMAVDLRRYMRGEAILARRASMVEKTWRWVRRRPALAAAIVLPLVVLAAAGVAIERINEEHFRQQGYQLVQVTTNPPGARVAIIPIDKRTGEPSTHADAAIVPSGKTPLTVYLKPDDYFVESVLQRDDGTLDMAEVYQTVFAPELVQKRNVKRDRHGREEAQYEFEIVIERTADVASKMVAVPISAALRRKNPLLPELLYIDQKETTPGQLNEPHIDFDMAQKAAQARSNRLPSAAEYDAIVKARGLGQVDGSPSSGPAANEELLGGLAEWTTTKYEYPFSADRANTAQLRGMHVLKGYGHLEEEPNLLPMPDGWIAPPDSSSGANRVSFSAKRRAAVREAVTHSGFQPLL